jgi:hypothetical protein
MIDRFCFVSNLLFVSSSGADLTNVSSSGTDLTKVAAACADYVIIYTGRYSMLKNIFHLNSFGPLRNL